MLGALAALAGLGPLARWRLGLAERRRDVEPEPPAARLPRGWPLPVLAFLVLGAAHSLVLPLLEGPDEDSHLKYAQYLSRTARVPTLVDRDLWIYEVIQPPLSYAPLASLLAATGADRIVTLDPPNPRYVRRGGKEPSFFLHGPDEEFPFGADVRLLHLLRLLGLAFGAATVLLATAIGSEVFPGRPGLGLACGWTVALLPQFAHVCGCFNNDGAAAAAGGAAILLLLRGARRGSPGAAFAAGLVGGLSAVTKLTGLAFLPAGLLLLSARPPGRRTSDRARVLGAFGLGFALAAGWLFLGNAVLYGDPLENLSLHRRVDAPIGAPPPAAWWKDIFSPIVFLSSFADFGWMTVVPGPLWIALFGALLAAAAGGWTMPGARARGGGVVAGFGLLGFATEAAVNLTFHQPQGRHLFFVLPALATLLVRGWSSLFPARPERAAAAGLLALGLAHAGSFWTALVPAFHPLNAREDPYRAFTNAAERRMRVVPAIEVEGPADGSAAEKAPVIRWSAVPGARYEVQLSVGEPDFGRPNWRLDRIVRRTYGELGRTAEGFFEFPSDAWSALPPGVPVFWRVVRLVPVADVEQEATVLETSAVRRVQRAPP
ncbi:MAG TPA: glycosyltransferase family 39 protein [Planctomycetota bacterium]|nr:glycosyltransferase family 39 protein [Planctomycetota bacterium]